MVKQMSVEISCDWNESLSEREHEVLSLLLRRLNHTVPVVQRIRPKDVKLYLGMGKRSPYFWETRKSAVLQHPFTRVALMSVEIRCVLEDFFDVYFGVEDGMRNPYYDVIGGVER